MKKKNDGEKILENIINNFLTDLKEKSDVWEEYELKHLVGKIQKDLLFIVEILNFYEKK